MTGFLQPGSDGDPSVSFEDSGFRDWRRGAVHTVRRMEALPHDRPYRILVAVRARSVKDVAVPPYGDLYGRAVAITETRLAEFAHLSPQGRTAAHAWGRYDGAFSFTFATIATVLAASGNLGMSLPPPSPAELMAPGGEMPAGAASASRHFDEIYNDFSFGSEQEMVMFSYGEYVTSADRLDFTPFLERAEHCAKLHHRTLIDPGDFRILRREWLFAGDANETQAVVHVYFRVPG